MWNLPNPPSDTAVSDLVTAFKRADGSFDYNMSDAEKTQMGEIYARYDQLKGRPNPELLAPGLTDALKTAIESAYEHVQKDKRLHKLREQLKLVASRCPLCGFSAVTDLDHHLPKSRYQAFSVYSRNLIPTCHTCNNKKRAIAAAEPDQHFIHAYLDPLPQERFLIAQSTMESGALLVDFAIVQTPSMSMDLYQRLTFQISRLELSERFRPEINVFLASMEIAFRDAFGADQSGTRVCDFLARSAQSNARIFGLNDWRVALLAALAANCEFCNGGFLQTCAVLAPTPATV
jgi:hypothetical protein